MTEAFAVTWRVKPYARTFLLDVDSLELAAEIGIRLNLQSQAYDIKVTSIDYQSDVEVDKEIAARIKDRINQQWAFEVMAT